MSDSWPGCEVIDARPATIGGTLNQPALVVALAPKVSIGLPVYNGQAFLGQTLDSLLSQTFSDFEIVICDNGSTDGTEGICRRYAARDGRIRYFRSETNRGASWNFNRAFELARGKYFKWAAGDDLCGPDFLAKCVAVLDANESVVLSFSQLIDIDEGGKFLRARQSYVHSTTPMPSRRFRSLIQMDHTCEEIFGLMRADVLRKTGLIGNYSDSDRVVLGHLGLYGFLHEVPEFLFFHRLHMNSSVNRFPARLERTQWFDPRAKGRILLPYWRELWEFVKVVAATPVGGIEKLRCYLHIGHWVWRNRRRLRWDVHQGLILLADKHFPQLRLMWRRLKNRSGCERTE